MTDYLAAAGTLTAEYNDATQYATVYDNTTGKPAGTLCRRRVDAPKTAPAWTIYNNDGTQISAGTFPTRLLRDLSAHILAKHTARAASIAQQPPAAPSEIGRATLAALDTISADEWQPSPPHIAAAALDMMLHAQPAPAIAATAAAEAQALQLVARIAGLDCARQEIPEYVADLILKARDIVHRHAQSDNRAIVAAATAQTLTPAESEICAQALRNMAGEYSGVCPADEVATWTALARRLHFTD